MVEINDESHGLHKTGSQIKSKNSMLRSSLCNYSHAYILASGTITIAKVAAGGWNNNIQVAFKSYASFTDCTSQINNTQIVCQRNRCSNVSV